jgi:predicted ABC-class ATPase
MPHLMDRSDLEQTLHRIDGRGYRAYKDLEGSWLLTPGLLLHIDHVQGDPFAAPSRLRLELPQSRARFPEWLYDHPHRRRGLEDFVGRAAAAAAKRVRAGQGSGKSGRVEVNRGGQEILRRSAVIIDDQRVELRLTAGLPAVGRRVLAREAAALLLDELPLLADRALLCETLDEQLLHRHCQAAEDQQALRRQLELLGLAAFVADGSVLPRRSGVDDRPLDREVVPFTSPDNLRVEVDLPHAGRISGMGIPAGVTLIVGGGFHGKSTLLQALERSVYDHLPGDGRELCATVPSAVKIRAEDGRRIERVNISPFIGRLPLGRDTTAFSTDNASGSTSQAANIIEALEMDARLLLLDEDTCATNFMIRDERMQALVPGEKEPITPFLDKVRQIYEERGVSTILVMGGSGDYFEAADLVLMMDGYVPRDVTAGARAVAERFGRRRQHEGGKQFGALTQRRPDHKSFDAARGRRAVKIDVKGLRTVLYGTTRLDLSCLEQLVDPAQTRALAKTIHLYESRYCGRGENIREELDRLFADLEREGFDLISPRLEGDLALPRIQEVVMAINRMRSLKVLP